MNERRPSRRTDPRAPVLSGSLRELLARYRFVERFAAGRAVLVIGAADGSGAARLADVAQKVVALDPVPALIQRAVRRYRRPNLRFAVGGPDVAGLTPASFDVITAFHRLDRVTRWPAFLDGVRAVMRPGGQFVIAVENANWEALGRAPAMLPSGAPAFPLAEFHDLLADRFKIRGLYGQSSAAKALLIHTAAYVCPHGAGAAVDLADRAAAVAGPATAASRYFVAVCERR
ncbi:MAG: class I SAM-dependent methyltransferase [Chloroflexota bacterium]|nr:class I SAM-dependent methyltransferase [Dehalococcoidia bacterium]MDW8253806.1 class I SAM-dependent methyltransferase [Chloroflexota bacterium]